MRLKTLAESSRRIDCALYSSAMREFLRKKEVPADSSESIGAPGIQKAPEGWYASLDGSHHVEVPEELAENIALSLRVQEKVREALMAGHKPGFISMISMLNCRKTIAAVSGARPLKELISRRRGNSDQGSDEIHTQAQLSGVPELMDDIEQMLDDGVVPVFGSQGSMQIEQYFDDHPDSFPQVVHVFNIIPRYESVVVSAVFGSSAPLTRKDMETKFHIDHTFIVLGKDEIGRYVCFQKRGSRNHHPFELQDLDSVINLSINPEADTTYLSFIGPITNAAAKEQTPQEMSREEVT
jgi:hypothetical protein